MKLMKKITAATVVVAMMITLLGVNVFAATKVLAPQIKVDGKTSVSIVTDKTTDPVVTVDVYMLDSEGDKLEDAQIAGTAFHWPEDPVGLIKSAEYIKPANGYEKATTDKVSQCFVATSTMSGISSVDPIGSFKFTFDATKITLNTDYMFEIYNTSRTNASGYTLADSFTPLNIRFIEETEIKSATAVTKDVAYGADLSSVLPSTVTCATETTTGTAGTMDVDVTWDTASLSTEPVVDGVNKLTDDNKTLTVEGTLTLPDGVKNTAAVKAAATVTIVPITGVAPAAVTGEVQQKDATDDQDTKVKDSLNTTVALPKYSDTVDVDWSTATVAWNSEGDITKLGSTATVIYTFASDKTSNNGIYKLGTSSTVNATVVVVPANIPGGTIKVNNPIENGKAKVTVTVPAAEIAKLAEGAEIVATIAAKNGTDPAATASVALEAEDIAAAADAENPVDYKAVLTVDKSMKTLGYAKDDTFEVNVTVAGTTLLNGESEDPVQGTVVKATSGGGSNFNPGSAPTTPTEPTEPTEPTKPTEPTEPTKPTEPTEPTTPADKFNDVEDSFWAAEDIYLLKEAGIINGKSASEFDPEGKVTRAEFTKMITQLFGVEATSGAAKFEDCGDADWFTPYVAAAVEAGLITGYSDTEFAPDKTITREEACTIIGRGLKAVAEGELTFTDASDVSDFAAEYVAILAAKGFINGYEDGSFLPANEITRAESAKIVANVFKSLKAEAEAEAPAEAETEAEAEAE